jgi:outer membrane protein OmpA-like peptidoglycan-associated protein
MLQLNKIIQKFIILSFMMIFACTAVNAQTTQPTWWWGLSGAANLNFYDGTTQRLNSSLIAPTAFHKAKGVSPYASVLLEYRPTRAFGLMLNLAYDGRDAKYDGVIAPCNCPANLQADINYIAVEPSIRLGFNKFNLYMFAGPTLEFNINKDFFYTQLNQPNTQSDLSAIHNTLLAGQVGIGYDIMVSKPTSTNKMSISPFVSYHPYFGYEPRTIESLSITTVRFGIALKFGKGHKAPEKEAPAMAVPTAGMTAPPVHNFVFTVRGPKIMPAKRRVSETFPMLNSVFFDDGSTEIPNRYVMLSKDQALSFKEVQLQDEQSQSMAGRSSGQLNVYHNVLNILGDRMRSNPGANIVLVGSSAKGPQDGKMLAASVKLYLVNTFGIDGARIAIRGSVKADPSSEHPGGTKELELLRADDRRVEIESTSSALLTEVGGGMMKSVQINSSMENPLDREVVFSVDSAQQLLSTWSVEATDQNGAVQHYGPFTGNEAGVPASSILGNNSQGDYKLVMQGTTTNGLAIRKESTIHLVHPDETVLPGYRYSIVFGFNKFTTIAEYNKFLTTVVAPLITDGATVTISGHTDIIGEPGYNLKLSDERAKQTQKLIEHALVNSGRDHVKFETTGFGEDAAQAPFGNTSPEERFYNRTVIIEIVPVK